MSSNTSPPTNNQQPQQPQQPQPTTTVMSQSNVDIKNSSLNSESSKIEEPEIKVTTKIDEETKTNQCSNDTYEYPGYMFDAFEWKTQMFD